MLKPALFVVALGAAAFAAPVALSLLTARDIPYLIAAGAIVALLGLVELPSPRRRR